MSPRRIARVELALRRIVPSPSWRRRVVLDRTPITRTLKPLASTDDLGQFITLSIRLAIVRDT